MTPPAEVCSAPRDALAAEEAKAALEEVLQAELRRHPPDLAELSLHLGACESSLTATGPDRGWPQELAAQVEAGRRALRAFVESAADRTPNSAATRASPTTNTTQRTTAAGPPASPPRGLGSPAELATSTWSALVSHLDLIFLLLFVLVFNSYSYHQSLGEM